MAGKKGTLLRVAAATAGLAAIALPLSNLPKEASPLGSQVGSNWMTPLGPPLLVVPPSTPRAQRPSVGSLASGAPVTNKPLASLLNAAQTGSGLAFLPSRMLSPAAPSHNTPGATTVTGGGGIGAVNRRTTTSKRTTPVRSPDRSKIATAPTTTGSPTTSQGSPAKSIGSNVAGNLSFSAFSAAASKASLASYGTKAVVGERSGSAATTGSGSATLSLSVTASTSQEHFSAQAAAVDAAKAKLNAPLPTATPRPPEAPTPVALAKAAEQAKLNALEPTVDQTKPATGDSAKPAVLEPSSAKGPTVQKQLPNGGGDPAESKRFAKILALKLGADKSGVGSGKK